jgi:hypothetical protein
MITVIQSPANNWDTGDFSAALRRAALFIALSFPRRRETRLIYLFGELYTSNSLKG